MARRKRGKSTFSIRRVLVLALIVAAVTALGWFGYTHRPHATTPIAPPAREAVPHKQSVPARVTLSGQLSAAAPVRDAQIGVSAPAAMLLRDVEIFETSTTCVGPLCNTRNDWREAAPDLKAPFGKAHYIAKDVQLDGLNVDPSILEQQLTAVDYPVKAGDLPPNMAATFTLRDGVLYAGGDPAHPALGTLRIRYRIIPVGPVTLSGIRKGKDLSQ